MGSVPANHVVTLYLGAAVAERGGPPPAVVGVPPWLRAAAGTVPVRTGPAQNIG